VAQSLNDLRLAPAANGGFKDAEKFYRQALAACAADDP